MAFICLIFAYADFSSVVTISGSCSFPMETYLFCLYLSLIHQGAVPSASTSSHCQAGYDSRWCYLKKVYRKKKVSPPSSTKAHPLKDIQAELTQFLNYKLQINTSIQYTHKKKAYLYISFSHKENHFSYTRKRLSYTKLRWNLLLDNIKAITRRNPFRIIKATSFALKFL